MNNRSVITGLALLVLFFSILNNFNLAQPQSVNIPYSKFLSNLDRGNILSVVIQGEHIKGITTAENHFHTISGYDPTLLPKLRTQKVQIQVKPAEDTPWYVAILVQIGPLALLIGVWIFMMRRMPGGGGGGGRIMSIGKSKAKKFEESGNPITFKDVAGVIEAKEELEEIVDYLIDPGKFQKLGGKIPKGVLMVGPPGTGKTLLAKAVAGEAGVPFFSISGSDFVEMFVGVGASRVRDLFKEAYESAPCIIFIDEIDAVGRHRGGGMGGGNDEREQTLNALLVEMDGFDGTEGIITIAATNRSDILDPALTRPGRFDRQVHVGLPDIKGRKEILEVHALKIKLEVDTDMSSIAKGTPGFSGAELANLINESALHAAQLDKSEVTLEDLEWARDKVMMGAERRSLIMTEKEKLETAYHEAGHAIVAGRLKKADPVHKITIIPRGQALGVTSFLPETDRLSMDRESLIQRITVSLGGRAAEELTMSQTTSGVQGDLQSATNMAYRMVTQWGMSTKLGALTVPDGDPNSRAMGEDPVGEETQELVDKEVKDILTKAYKQAMKILKADKKILEALAKMLMEQETVDADEFLALLAGKPMPKKPVKESKPKVATEDESKDEPKDESKPDSTPDSKPDSDNQEEPKTPDEPEDK